MACSNPLDCSPCEFRHITKQATLWCTNCCEALCGDCSESHSASKAFRNHQVISVEDYQKMAPIAALIQDLCIMHDRKFDYYCKYHDQMTCLTCIPLTHADCNQSIIPLEDAAKGSKSSVAFADLEQSLKDAIKNTERTIHDRNENMKILEDQKSHIQTEIKQIRTQINSVLDRIEEKIMEDLNCEYIKLTSASENRVGKLMTTSKELNTLVGQMQNLKQFASEIQTFLATREISKTLEQTEVNLNEVISGISDQTFALKINPLLEIFISDINSYGDIVVSDRPKTLILSQRKSKQAQLNVIHSNLPTSQLEFAWQEAVDFVEAERNASRAPVFRRMHCIQLFNNSIVAVDWIHKKIFYGLHGAGVSFSDHPYGMAMVDEIRVAISFNPGNHVDIFNTSKKEVERSFNFQKNCYGVSFCDGKLFVVVDGDIEVISLYGQTVTTIQIMLEDFYSIFVHKNRIYCSSKSEDILRCYDMSGNQIWKFQDLDLVGPRGVTSDSKGNIYVVGFYSYNIFVISPDGKLGKLLHESGLFQPHNIFYNESSNSLIVSGLRSRFIECYKIV